MNRLFWGLFFVLMDVYLELGTAEFELLPDFVGFFLMMKGMEELAGINRHFDRGRHIAFGLSVVSVILYVAHLLDLETMAQAGIWAVELGVLAVQLVLVGAVVRGIREVERKHGWDLRGENLRLMYLILAVLSVLSHLVSWVPLIGNICWVGELLVSILFLAAFRGMWKSYLENEKSAV